MEIGSIRRAAIHRYLRLLRLPVDIAIRMMPDAGTGIRPATRATVDRADEVVRVMLGIASAAAGDREGGAGEAHDREKVKVHPRARGPEQRMSAGPRPSQQRPQGKRPAADAAARVSRPRRQRAAAAMAGVQERIPPKHAGRTSANGDNNGAEKTQIAAPAASPDRQAARPERPGARHEVAERDDAQTPTTGPSHEAIAARAYELYQRGVPGDAAAHWQIAETELRSSN
jgi:Protein of unknown function (DUF2934)